MDGNGARGTAADVPIVLTHATVIAGNGSPPLLDQTISIVGDRIGSIHHDSQVPGNAQVLDCTGKYVIPGLWDMHVHFCMPGAGEKALEKFVRRGITSARDLGGDPWVLQGWREEISQGSRVGPYVYRAGPVVDSPKPWFRLAVETEFEARAAVTSLRRGLGSDVIKVHDGLSRAAFFGLAEEARAQDIPFVSHLPKQVSVEEVSESGGRSIEHVAESLATSVMLHSGGSPLSVEDAVDRLLGSEGRSMFDTIARRGAWVDPTLAAYSVFVRLDAETDPSSVPLRQALLDKFRVVTRKMRDRGVKLLAGSDYAGNWSPLDVTDELGMLQDAGLSTLECLQAATRNSAECMGRLSDVGTVEMGKLADIVVLDADPLTDISNVRRVHRTFARGRLVLPT